jgi:hypothetical protein
MVLFCELCVYLLDVISNPKPLLLAICFWDGLDAILSEDIAVDGDRTLEKRIRAESGFRERNDVAYTVRLAQNRHEPIKPCSTVERSQKQQRKKQEQVKYPSVKFQTFENK